MNIPEQKQSTNQDSELGLILLRSNSRAVRFTFSVKEGQLVATIPLHATKKELLHAVEKLRPRLRELLSRQQSKQKVHHVTPDFRIQVEGFAFRTAFFPLPPSSLSTFSTFSASDTFSMSRDGSCTSISVPVPTTLSAYVNFTSARILPSF